MNLALKDISHNLGRFLLTCIGLSLLLGIVLAMVGIYRGLILESLGLVRAAGAQVWVVEGDTRGPFAEASRLPGEMREAVAAQWGVAAAGGVSYQNVEAQHRGGTLRLLVVGAQIARPGRSAARDRGPADPAQPLRGGRRPRRRACARRADQARARYLHRGGADPEPRRLGRRSGHLHHAARRAEAAVRPDAGGGAARGCARSPARPERSTP